MLHFYTLTMKDQKEKFKKQFHLPLVIWDTIESVDCLSSIVLLTILMAALKEKGYNTNKIRTEGLLSQSTLQKFRQQQGVSWENLETLCRLLDCQPADLIEYQAED